MRINVLDSKCFWCHPACERVVWKSCVMYFFYFFLSLIHPLSPTHPHDIIVVLTQYIMCMCHSYRLNPSLDWIGSISATKCFQRPETFSLLIKLHLVFMCVVEMFRGKKKQQKPKIVFQQIAWNDQKAFIFRLNYSSATAECCYCLLLTARYYCVKCVYAFLVKPLNKNNKQIKHWNQSINHIMFIFIYLICDISW